MDRRNSTLLIADKGTKDRSLPALKNASMNCRGGGGRRACYVTPGLGYRLREGDREKKDEDSK